jgi:exonuclease III
MVAKSLNRDNQLPINSFSLSRSKTTKMVHKKKQTYCSNNSLSRINSASSPTVTNKSFTVFHQNIRGSRNKNNKLLKSLLPKLPHVICLTEHHSIEQETETLSLDYYILGAKFCRQSLKYRCTGVFVHEFVAFTNIDLQEFCMEQDIETCAVKINLLTTIIYVIYIYRLPTCNFARFIKGINTILNQFSKPNIEIIVCGDINIGYLDETCYKRQQLDALLATYSLTSTVQFPTRSLNGSISATDNLFIGIYHKSKYTIYPLINGLSDHNRQIIQLEIISIQTQLSETRII